jgi:uncharacterized protein
MRNLLYIILLGIPLLSVAQEFPARSNRLVNDYTNTLSASEGQELEEKLVRYSNETSVQIAVVIIQSLEGYEISEYAFELGEKWGIGQSGTNNGALILVSIDDRKMWIATGYGLESTLTDALCRRIVENEMKPRFRNGDFAGGLTAAADAIISVTKGEYAEQGNGGQGDPLPIVITVIALVFGIWILVTLVAVSQARKYARLNNMGFWAAWMLLNAARKKHTDSWSSFSGGRGHFGGFSGGGGGGGFGGFGGGSFGGGGAGGSW